MYEDYSAPKTKKTVIIHHMTTTILYLPQLGIFGGYNMCSLVGSKKQAGIVGKILHLFAPFVACPIYNTLYGWGEMPA